MQTVPEIGQLTIVRKRPFVVTEIIPSARGLSGEATKANHIIKLSSVEDDGLGEELQVIWELEPSFTTYQHSLTEQQIELLWSGPSPANQIPARRIDQTLYDLIANAKCEILMVTFAAAKIERLTGELWKAAKVGVKIRLVLEFEETSEGQLSYDAMKAFPAGPYPSHPDLLLAGRKAGKKSSGPSRETPRQGCNCRRLCAGLQRQSH